MGLSALCEGAQTPVQPTDPHGNHLIAQHWWSRIRNNWIEYIWPQKEVSKERFYLGEKKNKQTKSSRLPKKSHQNQQQQQQKKSYYSKSVYLQPVSQTPICSSFTALCPLTTQPRIRIAPIYLRALNIYPFTWGESWHDHDLPSNMEGDISHPLASLALNSLWSHSWAGQPPARRKEGRE